MLHNLSAGHFDLNKVSFDEMPSVIPECSFNYLAIMFTLSLMFVPSTRSLSTSGSSTLLRSESGSAEDASQTKPMRLVLCTGLFRTARGHA